MKKTTNTNETVEVKKEKTIEMIADEIKTKHGLKEVFITDIAGQFVIWRKIKRSEYKEVMTATFDKMKEIFNMHEFETRGVYAREVKKCPGYMQDFLFHCFDSRIFWDYAKSWSTSKWAKAIDGLKEN